MAPLKEFWRGRKFYTQSYPLQGAKSNGTAAIPVDILKQGLTEDTIETLSIHLVGPIVVSNGVIGAASGAYNPESLVTLTTLQTAPQAAGLTPVNAVGPRIAVIDDAAVQGSFRRSIAVPDTVNTTQQLDAWVHFDFKRPQCRKGIEFAHPLKKWNTDTLNVVLGTRDQLFTGGTNTWDMSGVVVEFWANLDVAANPENIHATELFEQDFDILASNTNFQINQLPAGVFYDNLYFATEVDGVLSDAIINNIDLDGSGRFWLPQGEGNAKFVREELTRSCFYDKTISLTGIYILPLRDGLWSRAVDARDQPIVIKLDVNFAGGHTYKVRLGGRKIVPGAIKRTIMLANGGKQVSGMPDA